MSIIQSAWSKGTKQIARPQTANAVHTQTFEYDFAKKALAATDILEIGAIPAYAKVIDAKLYADTALADISVGLLTGAFGSTDAARTADATLFASGAVSATAVSRLALSSVLKRAAQDTDVGIGVKAAAAVSAGKLYLELSFIN